MHRGTDPSVGGEVLPILASSEEEALSESVYRAIANIAAERRVPIDVIANSPEAHRLYKTSGLSAAALDASLRAKYLRRQK